jgi:hypothetical protein
MATLQERLAAISGQSVAAPVQQQPAQPFPGFSAPAPAPQQPQAAPVNFGAPQAPAEHLTGQAPVPQPFNPAGAGFPGAPSGQLTYQAQPAAGPVPAGFGAPDLQQPPSSACAPVRSVQRTAGTGPGLPGLRSLPGAAARASAAAGPVLHRRQPAGSRHGSRVARRRSAPAAPRPGCSTGPSSAGREVASASAARRPRCRQRAPVNLPQAAQLFNAAVGADRRSDWRLRRHDHDH